MLVLGCGHLSFDHGVDLLQVGGCLMFVRLLRVLGWLVEVEVRSGVSPEGGEEGAYLRSLAAALLAANSHRGCQSAQSSWWWLTYRYRYSSMVV